MELILYARILMKKWWIVVPAFLITLASTILLTFRQAPTYQATATMVVAPSSKVGDMKVIATNLEILSSRAQIASTYAEVASSRLIKREAVEELNISSSQAKALTIESQLRAGTNVIEITVQGNDPRLVSDVANKVIDRVTAYAEGLYEIYDLKTLDKAQPPSSPTGPNTLLNLALGAVLGLVLGAGLALLSQYLQASVGSAMNTSMPNVESVAHSSNYFMQRLNEEMSRAERNKYPLSLALMNVDQSGVVRTSMPPELRSEALHTVTVFLKQFLREEDVMAQLGETTFAFLLPDTPVDKAQASMENLHAKIAGTTFEMCKSGRKLSLSTASGVSGYKPDGTGHDGLLALASQALRQAEMAGCGQVVSLA